MTYKTLKETVVSPVDVKARRELARASRVAAETLAFSRKVEEEVGKR